MSATPQPSRTVIVTVDASSTYTSGSYLVVAEPTDGTDWETSPTSFPDPVASGSPSKKLGILEIVAIVAGSVALLVAISLSIYFYVLRLRRRRRDKFESRCGPGIEHIYNHHDSMRSSQSRHVSRLATPITSHSRSSSTHPSPPVVVKLSKSRSITPGTPLFALAQVAAEDTKPLELNDRDVDGEVTVYTYEEGKRAKEEMWKAAGYNGSPKIPPLPSIAPSVRSAWSRPGGTDRGSVSGSEISPTSATTSRRLPGRREIGTGTETVLLPSYYYPSG